MLFNIDGDSGSRIEGWIMPDNPSVTPSVLVVIEGEAVSTITAQVLRPLLREQGLHETGVCGFIVDAKNCPPLAGAETVELYDTDTNVRVYRRRPASADVDAKLFRLEAQLLRDAALNEVLDPHFHMAFTRLDSFPEETAKSILGLPFSNSLYVTGRMYYRAFEPLLRDRGFKSCIYLRDPLEELAEQLLLLQWAKSRNHATHKGVLPESFIELMAVLEPDTMNSMGNLEKWLIGLSPRARQPLSDPLARLLTCMSPDDRPSPHVVSEALDTLAEFTAVGFRSDMPAFAAHLEAGLDLDMPAFAEATRAKRVTDLAGQLDKFEVVHQLLAVDREVYATARQAFDVALATR